MKNIFDISKSKYQCFISSTYDDLKEERAECTKAILKMGHIPAGMEYFEAGRPQKEIIKKWMDESDIIIFIVGGRYGTVDKETGNGYVEDEYDYAIEKGKPCFTICLSDSYIHQKESEYKKYKSTVSAFEQENKEKYASFKEKVRKKECVEVEYINEISSAVIKNIYSKINNCELAGGWIKYQDNVIVDILSGNITTLNEDVKQELFNNLMYDKLHAYETGGQEIADSFCKIIHQYNNSLERYLKSMSRAIKLVLYDNYIEVHNTVDMVYQLAPNSTFTFIYNPWMYEGLESDTFEIKQFKYNGKPISKKCYKPENVEYTSNPFYVTNVVKVEVPFDKNIQRHEVYYSVKYQTNYDRYFHEYMFKEFCHFFSLNVSLEDNRTDKTTKEYVLKWGMFTPYKKYDQSSQRMLGHSKKELNFSVSDLMIPGNGYVITLNNARPDIIKCNDIF